MTELGKKDGNCSCDKEKLVDEGAIAAGIRFAVTLALKILDDISEVSYQDENIMCYWNLPIVRQSREKSAHTLPIPLCDYHII